MNSANTRPTRYAALAAAAIIAASLTACKPGQIGANETPDPVPTAATTQAAAGNPTAARQQLAALRIATPGPMTGYSRTKFGHGWASHGNSCDTREIVLQRQGRDVRSDPKTCKATSGTWVSLYDGVTVHDPSELDIDHLVPEAEAWRTGAASWPQDQRERFANDWQTELVAVTAHSNRSKGDGPPPEYLPAPAERCDYAVRWVAVKSEWKLTISNPEKTALGQMLNTCR